MLYYYYLAGVTFFLSVSSYVPGILARCNLLLIRA
jgi:hypothetical protein